MSELRAVRRLRPDIEPLDDASFERIWSDVAGTSASDPNPTWSTEFDREQTFDIGAPPNTPRRHRALTAAAAALVLVGVGAVMGIRSLVDGPDPTVPAAQPPPAPASDDSGPLPPATVGEHVLVLPADSVEPTYVQRNAALPHRTRGLVSAPDGSTLSINLFENFWGELPAEMDQRDIGGLTWATTVEDTNRGYVTVDECTMLSVNAGPNGAAWDTDAVALMNSVRFTPDSITIDLPDGWQTIDVGPVGAWYSMSFDPGIEGSPDVTLTQMPGSNAGPLLADFAGRPVTAITIDGSPGWQVPLDNDGWTQTVWQNDSGSMMLTSKGLDPGRIDQLLTQLSPATASDWDTRYSDQDAGADSSIADPVCEPATLRGPSQGT